MMATDRVLATRSMVKRSWLKSGRGRERVIQVGNMSAESRRALLVLVAGALDDHSLLELGIGTD